MNLIRVTESQKTDKKWIKHSYILPMVDYVSILGANPITGTSLFVS